MTPILTLSNHIFLKCDTRTCWSHMSICKYFLVLPCIGRSSWSKSFWILLVTGIRLLMLSINALNTYWHFRKTVAYLLSSVSFLRRSLLQYHWQFYMDWFESYSKINHLLKKFSLIEFYHDTDVMKKSNIISTSFMYSPTVGKHISLTFKYKQSYISLNIDLS